MSKSGKSNLLQLTVLNFKLLQTKMTALLKKMNGLPSSLFPFLAGDFGGVAAFSGFRSLAMGLTGQHLCIYNVDTMGKMERNGGKLMRAALSKWGNSLAVRIPKALADSARLREGEPVEIESLRSGEILIRRRKTLDQLVKAITPENRHAATDWGPPVGKEIW